ncbi:biopolymer transport protein ExbD/TolR [bacterium BMS3Abin05]|nr:biopolymer transport protein ExbD/TolR [bacterium BMS3Abin05]GBE26331.1 biopolymer transport protein ExbD/TolR [bacterium BMS3Bbin03]HDZ12304.1 biopolymer transporter ExbD [Bacteroidota bacterium]
MAFVPSRIKRHITGTGEVKLNLTSMMDMFTIILVFLLKVYSSNGQMIQPSHDLTLPNSSVQKHAEQALNLKVSKEWVVLNDKPVAKIADVVAMRSLIIPQLARVLKKYATEAQKMEELYGTPFTGKVVIQGDKDLPYKVLVKIMATCGRSEYPNMRLLVYQNHG